MNNTVPAVLAQLTAQSPSLLVYLVGLTLAVVFWKRMPLPCLLTALATTLLFFVAVSQTLLTQYLIGHQSDMAWTSEDVGHAMTLIGAFSGGLRAVGLGVLIAAVFVRREPASPTPSSLA